MTSKCVFYVRVEDAFILMQLKPRLIPASLLRHHHHLLLLLLRPLPLPALVCWYRSPERFESSPRPPCLTELLNWAETQPQTTRLNFSPFLPLPTGVTPLLLPPHRRSSPRTTLPPWKKGAPLPARWVARDASASACNPLKESKRLAAAARSCSCVLSPSWSSAALVALQHGAAPPQTPSLRLTDGLNNKLLSLDFFCVWNVHFREEKQEINGRVLLRAAKCPSLWNSSHKRYLSSVNIK